MPRVLLVECEPEASCDYAAFLQSAGFDVSSVGVDAPPLTRADCETCEVAVLDLDVDRQAGDRQRTAVMSHATPALILLTAHASIRGAVDAMRDGASDYREKPLTAHELVDAVVKVVARTPPPLPRIGEQPRDGEGQCYAASRWAKAVVSAALSTTDPKTLHGWGRSVAASPGAIRNWCRTANLPARRSLVFARLLRAVLQRQRYGLTPEESLNVVDRRTLVSLLDMCHGPGRRSRDLPCSVHDFLECQRVIQNPHAIREVRRALRHVVSGSRLVHELH
jgi:CheY-like chemotaxis protein